jgi:2-oxoisovalerate dehydrogenase E1 component
VLKEWVASEDADVEVGQKLAVIEVEEAGPAPVPQRKIPVVPEPEFDAAVARRHGSPTEGGLSSKIWGQMKNVVPTHMTMKCPWGGIRQARADAKKALGADAPSPTALVAWCVVRAMERHPIFCCTINADDTLTPHENFDFGLPWRWRTTRWTPPSSRKRATFPGRPSSRPTTKPCATRASAVPCPRRARR